MSVPLVLVYARAANGTIGRDGAMPWHLPKDLKHFVQVTTGKPMIMGRKTFESFDGPLKGRRHIVLTRDEDWQADGAEVVHSCEEALQLAADGPEIAVIGGAEIYQLFRDDATRIEMTQIHRAYEGDTTMPAPGEGWREVAREDHAEEGERPAFSFLTFERA